MKSFFQLSIALCAIVVFALASASAQTYDFFQTDPNNPPSVDLSSIAGLSPSNVSFQGVPIQPQGCMGNTDTLIQRSNSSGALQPTVSALMMKSTNGAGNPVQYNGANVDVYVTINNSGGTFDQNTLPAPDNPLQTPGSMTIGSGGTFNSSLNVNPDIILVPAGTARTALNSSIIASFSGSNFQSTMTATGSTGPASSNYPNCAGIGLSSGGIQVTTLTHTAPTHVHQVVPSCVSSSTTGAASTGGGVVVECAVLANPTVTTTSKTAPKPAAK